MITICRSSGMTSFVIGISLLLQPGHRYLGRAFGQQANSTPAATANDRSTETHGDTLLSRREYQAAIDAYSKGPDQSAAIFNKIGLAYQHLYAIDKAKMSYERALRLKPDFPDALNNLGTVFYQEGDFRKAEQLYRRALKLEPGNATVAKNLGAAYFAEGNLRRGTEAYRIALLSDPSSFSDNSEDVVGKPAPSNERYKQDYCLAALFAHAGMNDQALEYLRKAIDAGFDDYRRLSADPDFAVLRKTPEYVQLMNEQHRQ